MKKIAILALILSGCIQTDFEDPFDPTFMISNEIADVAFRVFGSYELVAIYTDDTGEPADAPIIWESTNTAILSFDENVATAHQTGEVLITATANGLSDTRLVEILPSIEAIQLTGLIPTILEGNSLTLGYSYSNPNGQTVENIAVLWESSNAAVASINNSGNLTALMAGETTISVSFGNVQDEMIVSVVAEGSLLMPEISISSSVMRIDEGSSAMFEAILFDESGNQDDMTSISWSSSNTDVLRVSVQGLVTAESVGMAYVVAEALGAKDSVLVQVDGIEAGNTRTGTLMGTSRYPDIAGDFTLSVNDNDELILTIENYTPSGPDPQLYLSNQAGISNGINLGMARASGNYEINVSEVNGEAQLSTYNVLVVWCERFGVLLGYGEFDN